MKGRRNAAPGRGAGLARIGARGRREHAAGRLRRGAAGFAVALFLAGSWGCAAQRGGDASHAASSHPWEGVWVSEMRFASRVEGPVTLHRSGDGWVARHRGDTVDVERTASADGSVEWAFSFLEDGRFVGRQTVDEPGTAAGAIDGHWLQAPGVVETYPFATPVQLRPAGADAYVGELRPFLQEVSLNISLVADGAAAGGGTTRYKTFLRNPQRNLGVFFPIASATVDGDEIRFADADGDERAVGRSTEPGERFTLRFPRFGVTFDFTRRPRHDAPGFYPRRSPESPGPLPRPAALDDAWATAAPAETGLDERPLADLVASIAGFEPTGLRQPYIHGLLLAHRGKLVVEEYFHGHHREMTHDSRSAGKSLTSVLLGIAVRRGDLDGIDRPVYDFFGGVDAFAHPDPRKERLTLRHLVTMSSG
ncbi:MAG: serine hydrolase, partial [Acidobacteriota bacterium]